MPLITARDFPGITQRRGSSLGGIPEALAQLFQQKKQGEETQRIEQIQVAKDKIEQFGFQAQTALGMDNIDRKKKFLAQMGQRIQREGGDLSEVNRLMAIENVDELNLALTQIATAAADGGERLNETFKQATGKELTTRAFAPVTLINHETKEKILVTPTFNPNTQKAELKPLDIPEGFELSVETPQEERAADVLAKGAGKRSEVTGKKIAERRQEQITTGLDSADATANVRRALDLLEDVKTGGVDAASLRIKQFFGVEGADEAELSSRLGKAVLSQLRATFGAAFTEREGARLASIEAGFGKSPAGNRRLLEQALRILERSAKRGMKAAEDEGDLDSAKDIRDALIFKLSEDSGPETEEPEPVDLGQFTTEQLLEMRKQAQ